MVLTAVKELLTDVRSRIAPTPSGYLHYGNAFSFVLSWLITRLLGGKLLLRIDDADTTRARPEYIEDIFRCLDWLGIDWDEGPQGPDDFVQQYSQQLRFGHYEKLLEVLVQSGMVYACNCSRSQIKRAYPNGPYGGKCRQQNFPLRTQGAAWRVWVHEGPVCFKEAGGGGAFKNRVMSVRCLELASNMGDFVVRRREGLAAYQIASLADDISMNINLIFRGEDLLYSTAAQIYLAQILATQEQDVGLRQGGAMFKEAIFLHHPLVLDSQGAKLSKSAGSTSLKSLREAGGTPMAVYARVASYLALPPDAAASTKDLLQASKELVSR